MPTEHLQPNSDRYPVLTIVGPTAVGKTEAAIRVALDMQGEIMSADSMAVYKGVDIGTAKPSKEVQQKVPYHLIDIVEPTDSFNAAMFATLATSVLQDCWHRGCLPILVGGTGLYVRALLDGLTLCGVPADPPTRSRLHAEICRRGAPALHTELRRVDPEAAARIHPNDAVRIVRALEVYEVTGQPMSRLAHAESGPGRGVPSIRFGLCMRMDALDRRINQRVDAMFAAGWLDEVRALLSRGVPDTAPSMRALGYREIISHLRGIISLDECVHMVKKSTRRYARRQMTWFRADPRIRWLDVTDTDADEVAARLIQLYTTALGGHPNP